MDSKTKTYKHISQKIVKDVSRETRTLDSSYNNVNIQNDTDTNVNDNIKNDLKDIVSTTRQTPTLISKNEEQFTQGQEET